MYNGDGLEIPHSPKAVERELLQGTGAVMADGASIHVEHLNVSDHQFVVARQPENSEAPLIERFPSNRFDAAWRRFQEWVRE